MRATVTSIEGAGFLIELKEIEGNVEDLQDRMAALLPLLESLLAADLSLNSLTAEQIEQRGAGILAMDMLCMSSISAATEQAKVLKAITDGLELIENHGFTEFASGQLIDV